MIEEIKEFLKKIDKKHWARKTKNIEKYVEYLNEIYPNVSLNFQLLSLMDNKTPYCINCQKPKKSLNKNTCTHACSKEHLNKTGKTQEINNKIKNTLIKNYGVDNPAKSKTIQEKRINTLNEKYGCGASPLAIEKAKERMNTINENLKNTLMERYGVSNSSQISDFSVKCKETLQKNYGVDNYFKSEEFKNFSKNKNYEKYNKMLPETITLNDIITDIEKTKIFENPNQIINFTCQQCNISDSLPSETLKWRLINVGTCCGRCSELNKGSLKEKEIYDFLSSDLKIDNLLRNKKLLNNYEIDIYDQNKNIGIEFNGLFWHNDLRVDKNYHLNKYLLSKEKNIKLIQIFEDEWDFKQEIVKSRLRYLFNKIENKISARKLKITKLNKKDAKLFFEQNHIQGHAPAHVVYGLVNKSNVIISAMSFSKPSKAKGQINIDNSYELLRFCSLLNTNVSGAANRLFKQFIQDFNPDNILTFSDLRWNSGNVYKNLGFEYKNDTRIGYWYISKGKRIHRYKLRKNNNDDINLTEYENRLKQGYYRIWDCGHGKWVWNKKAA